MDRILLLVTVTIIATTAAKAQSVTYNHDSPKQNQVTVMETGTGALSPDLYYSILHNKYKKSAAAKNKLSFRTLAGVNLYNQTDEAETIDSALVSQAKIEALNVADRQADIAWLAEGDKVNGQMVRFKRNIDRILPVGGHRRIKTDGRNITISTSAPLMQRKMPICPTHSGKRVSAHLRGYNPTERNPCRLPCQTAEYYGNKYATERYR